MYKTYDQAESQIQSIIKRINSIIPVIVKFDNENLSDIQNDYQEQNNTNKRPRKLTQELDSSDFS